MSRRFSRCSIRCSACARHDREGRPDCRLHAVAPGFAPPLGLSWINWSTSALILSGCVAAIPCDKPG
jgi:hypothetical protein